MNKFWNWVDDGTKIIFCKPTAGIPWSADIVLNDTRVSDAGIYRCMVNNPPETADPGIGELVLSILGKFLTLFTSARENHICCTYLFWRSHGAKQLMIIY